MEHGNMSSIQQKKYPGIDKILKQRRYLKEGSLEVSTGLGVVRGPYTARPAEWLRIFERTGRIRIIFPTVRAGKKLNGPYGLSRKN